MRELTSLTHKVHLERLLLGKLTWAVQDTPWGTRVRASWPFCRVYYEACLNCLSREVASIGRAGDYYWFEEGVLGVSGSARLYELALEGTRAAHRLAQSVGDIIEELEGRDDMHDDLRDTLQEAVKWRTDIVDRQSRLTESITSLHKRTMLNIRRASPEGLAAKLNMVCKTSRQTGDGYTMQEQIIALTMATVLPALEEVRLGASRQPPNRASCLARRMLCFLAGLLRMLCFLAGLLPSFAGYTGGVKIRPKIVDKPNPPPHIYSI